MDVVFAAFLVFVAIDFSFIGRSLWRIQSAGHSRPSFRSVARPCLRQCQLPMRPPVRSGSRQYSSHGIWRSSSALLKSFQEPQTEFRPICRQQGLVYPEPQPIRAGVLSANEEDVRNGVPGKHSSCGAVDRSGENYRFSQPTRPAPLQGRLEGQAKGEALRAPPLRVTASMLGSRQR